MKIGTKIAHKQFGEGIITNIDERKIDILFLEHGEKHILSKKYIFINRNIIDYHNKPLRDMLNRVSKLQNSFRHMPEKYICTNCF